MNAERAKQLLQIFRLFFSASLAKLKECSGDKTLTQLHSIHFFGGQKESKLKRMVG